MPRSRPLAYALLAALLVAAFDVWNWERIEPLLFGWMPVGLWWQVLVTMLAVPVMAYLFWVLWPDDVDDAWAAPAPRDGKEE
ncbi:MAG TPA: hypothetical protein VHJ34_12535 [Actinomycetota bacterium]|nr:hypothetical protein [Actinomycetota bacterium]